MKNFLILFPYPFTEFEYYKYEIQQLKKNYKCNVIVHDLSYVLSNKKLIEVLKTSSTDEEPEEIQTKIYEIGMSLKFENLKDWFSAFYQVILGQDQGPRLGSFIKFYGLKKTILLLEEKLLDEK